MTLSSSNDRERLEEWLAILQSNGSHDRVARDRAAAELRAVGTEKVFPLLSPMLDNSDADLRCTACETILRVDAERGMELVLPRLNDFDAAVRWFVCGCLHDLGDERAIETLVEVMRHDSDVMVRGAAAYALGGIGSPAAIPALLEAMASDHKVDMHGHSPSSCAASALDDIIGTNETRIRLTESLYRMQTGDPDLDRLRQLAESFYERWSVERAE